MSRRRALVVDDEPDIRELICMTLDRMDVDAVPAENLEAARDEIVRRWGEALYRRFRLYLWGSAFAFLNRGMEAYRVVLERPREAVAPY